MIRYDYVIIGGGSSGCVLAARLTEDPDCSVLLIEAGKDVSHENAPEEVLSGYPAKAYFNKDFIWPSLQAFLGGTLGNRREARHTAKYEQARILGGGSSINGLVANRGAPTDYDQWAEFGGPEWRWEAVLPYFRKLERDLDFDGEYHGKDGPVTIRRFPREDWSGFVSAVADLLQARGYPYVADQNGDWQDGIMPVTASIDEKEQRVSCALAYLTPSVRKRPNLTIMTETLVRRIVFEARQAVGVELQSGAETRRIDAGEVLLCAGTVHSPAMLMRSGIGRAADLRELGIEVIAERAGVGQNLQEHPAISVSCYLRPSARLKNLNRHQTQVHVRFSSGVEGCALGDMSLALIARSAWHALGQRIGSLYFWVNNSHSKGHVSLRSADIQVEPAVDFNMLSDPRDRVRLRQAFLFLAEIAHSPELDSVRTKVFPANFSDRVRKVSSPGLWNGIQMRLFSGLLDAAPLLRGWLVDTLITQGITMQTLLSDTTELDRFLDRSVAGVWHPVGTCRMGTEDDRLAVTDGHGRVHGIGRLRVCDASVMPTIPSANTNIPTIMLAEKMADFIKAERKALATA